MKKITVIVLVGFFLFVGELAYAGVVIQDNEMWNNKVYISWQKEAGAVGWTAWRPF